MIILKGCFFSFLWEAFAYKAELNVVIHAIEIAQKSGWDHIWLECDSTYVRSEHFFFICL